MKTITIKLLVDVARALEKRELNDDLYMFDNQRRAGSQHEGTNRLATVVSDGDTVVWTVASVECEAYAALAKVDIDPDYCEVQRKMYPETDIAYWVGTVKKPITELAYGLSFELVRGGLVMSTSGNAKLIAPTP